MAASRKDISEWFDSGIDQGATHMMIVCDTFDHEDYPKYVMPKENVLKCSQSLGDMQSLVEVYHLGMDKERQLNQHRAFNYVMTSPDKSTRPTRKITKKITKTELKDIIQSAWPMARQHIADGISIPKIMDMAARHFWVAKTPEDHNIREIRHQIEYLEEHGSLDVCK